MVERLVPDGLWELFQRVVPEAPTRPQGGGRPRHGDREVLAAIIFVATTGCTWAQLPAVCGRLGEHACFQRGDLTGPDPVDRGKKGAKIHLITDRTGVPISMVISGANLHDSQALQPLVRAIPPIRSRRGHRRRKPGRLHGDKGYDYNRPRRWLRERGIVHRLARKGVESSQRLGRHRWQVERTMAWPAGCRRLHRRYERKAEHFLAFADIACTLICFRRPTK